MNGQGQQRKGFTFDQLGLNDKEKLELQQLNKELFGGDMFVVFEDDKLDPVKKERHDFLIKKKMEGLQAIRN